MIFVWAAVSAAAQISATSKLKDFEFERTSPNVLTFGAECSTRTPCNVRFNQRTHSFTAGWTVVLGGSSPKGMPFAYVTSDGKLSIGSGLSIASCTGCIAVSGATSFPQNTVPLWTWTATTAARVWDRDGGVDRRGFQSAKAITPGLGIQFLSSLQAWQNMERCQLYLRVCSLGNN